jgi:glucose-1-phosphatase
MIKTILCDLGNVIVFFDNNLVMENFAKYSNKSKAYIKSFFWSSRARKAFALGKINSNQLYLNFKKHLNLKLNFQQFKKVWCSCFTTLNKDIEILLKKLKKNHKLIMLSNTDAIHFPYIKNKYKFLNIFDEFILSYEVGFKKPDPRIYFHALKIAKTAPNEILYFDDLALFIAVSKFFGIRAIQHKNLDKFKLRLEKENLRIK